MNKIAVTIRKFDCKHGNYQNPSRKVLHRQMLKLHKNIKKNDPIFTEYAIEKDSDKSKYHSHLLIQYNNKKNLYDELSRFIGGSGWKIRENGLDTFDECNGKYGCIYTEEVRGEWHYRRYMNKKELTKTLI
ncbi:hypothetical protein DHD32_10275 [Arenibacter sp. TNZ]|uniref:hypothetical protein n=1 Tax=Arenibacter TaxID=178469 RepID=UPI000CD450D4|nr:MULTISPECIES: hypothetical protein [Arenibacter]MCM4171868.1 hypothetical protein [Arenibacter sp. TNZ]